MWGWDVSASQLFRNSPEEDLSGEKRVFECLGYSVSVEHRVRRIQGGFVVEYRVSERFQPSFSEDDVKETRSEWKRLAVFDSLVLARRAMIIVKEAWTFDDYLRTESEPEQTRKQFQQTVEKMIKKDK